jgi:hypothetical protein
LSVRKRHVDCSSLVFRIENMEAFKFAFPFIFERRHRRLYLLTIPATLRENPPVMLHP